MAVKAEKNVSGNAAPVSADGNGEVAATAAPKRRGRAKGAPVGPRLVWTPERESALARILSHGYMKQEDGTWVKNPAYNGSTCTANSVAQALAEDPAFANPEAPVTPERVKAYISSVVTRREKEGKPVHEWLNLSRSARSRDTSAFD
jgi:hypothetical protein